MLYCAFSDFGNLQAGLDERGLKVESSGFEWLPQNMSELGESEADEVLEMEIRTRELEAEVLHKILKQAPPDEIPALRLIIESISRTAEYGADIAETVLNMTVKDAVIEA